MIEAQFADCLANGLGAVDAARRPFEPFSGEAALPSLADAYGVQRFYIASLAGQLGTTIAGYKVGLTSPRNVAFVEALGFYDAVVTYEDLAPAPMATSQSPSVIAWADEMMACSPEPQSRLTLKAGASLGQPAPIAATRLR